VKDDRHRRAERLRLSCALSWATCLAAGCSFSTTEYVSSASTTISTSCSSCRDLTMKRVGFALVPLVDVARDAELLHALEVAALADDREVARDRAESLVQVSMRSLTCR
jgi:hypothetical protein